MKTNGDRPKVCKGMEQARMSGSHRSETYVERGGRGLPSCVTPDPKRSVGMHPKKMPVFARK